MSGSSLVGGFVGYNFSGSVVSYVYSMGLVNGSTSVGGLIGFNDGTTTNSFWDTQTSGQISGVGGGSSTGATGKTTAEMKTLSTFIAAVWDFDGESANGTSEIWDIDNVSQSINSGYPFLAWENGATTSVFYNAAPTLSKNTGLTLNEGATATISNTQLQTTDSDNTASQLTYTITDIPDNGTLKLNGNPIVLNGTFTQDDIDNSRVSYSHNGGGSSSDSFTFDVKDPSAAGPTGQTFSITINSVNDLPVVSNIAGTVLSYTEGDSAVVISGTITVNDNDDVNIESAVVQISGNYKSGEDELSFTDQNGIIGSWDAEGGTITLNGTSSTSNYQTALQSVKYKNTSSNPDTLLRGVSFTVNDGDGNSNTVTRTIKIIPVNNVPKITSQLNPVTFNEDNSIVFKLSSLHPFIDDPDNADSTLTITLSYAGDNLILEEATDTSVTIKGKENWFGTDTVTVNVSDGSSTLNASLGVHVLSVNDLPVFSNVPDNINVPAGDSATVNVFELVSDVETPDTLLSFEFLAGNDSLNFSFNEKTGDLKLSSESGYSGETELQIKVFDEAGDSTETSISVTVEALVTGITDLTGIPVEYELYHNYPNPFNPSTKIRYGLPSESKVRIVIYNILGQEVSILKNTTQSAGYHEVEWNATRLSSGMYIYRISAESTNGESKYTQVKKMLMIK